ncbi:MAG TPA: ABC transporter ATP-binding protein [Oscillospiraceae bacterium]|nr:ABC transporter ATP-binding protein [Oscillospiraceae bacterium]
MISLQDVSFHYKRGKWVFQELNLEIRRNLITFIVGPNGGGKTTLGKLMAGILKPQTGMVLIDNLNTKEVPLAELGAKVGYLFQEPERQIFANTVREEIGFVLDLREVPPAESKAKVDQALAQFQLTHLAALSPLKLSRGEKQRLVIAAIMVNQPQFFILDEPTTGLDQERKAILSGVIEGLQQQGIGMAIISHDQSFVQRHAQQLITVAKGEIVDVANPNT